MNFKQYLNKYIIIIVIAIAGKSFAYNTITYNAQNGIVSNTVQKIHLDKSNRIWLGTENGISQISSNGIKNFVYDQNWENNQIWAIYETPDSTMWFGSFRGNLYTLKNDTFARIKLPLTTTKSIIRRFYLKDNQLFIGGDCGLFVMDYKTKQLINYSSRDSVGYLQVMNFFSIQDTVYFQTTNQGIFKVDHHDHSYKRHSTNYFQRYSVFCTQVIDDTLRLSRSKVNHNEPYNKFKISVNDFLNKVDKIDSLPLNTIAWSFAKDNNNRLFAACWGVNDIGGGLYQQINNRMVKVNKTYDIESNKLWDILYNEKQNKLYVSSKDKGVYVVDLNDIVGKDELFGTIDVLDIEMINDSLYVLTTDELIKVVDHQITKRISYATISHFQQNTVPFIGYNAFFQNSPLTLREIIDLKDRVGITGNKGLLFFNYNLEPQQYIHVNGLVRAALLENNDIVLSVDYGVTELFKDMGKGPSKYYSFSNPSNPRDITHSCRVNNNMTLFSSTVGNLYLYNHTEQSFKKFSSLGDLRLPGIIESFSDNRILIMDKSNRLYDAAFEKDSFKLSLRVDFGFKNVVETYFMKKCENHIVIGTNKGVYIISNDRIQLINHEMGLPKNILYRTVQYYNDVLYLASSDGIYQIKLNNLSQLECDYTLDNLAIEYDSIRYDLTTGKYVRLTSDPNHIKISWELNTHPYPRNLSYEYNINQDETWHPIPINGELNIVRPKYGINTIYLKIIDESLGNNRVVKLAEINLVRPFYKNPLFMIGLLIIIIALFFYILYRRKIKRLKKSELIATNETIMVKQRLEILQFLLKPHFIFNALTSIQNLIIEKDFNKSLTYTSIFSKFLRSIIDNTSDELIKLDDELKNLESYIELEKLRFNEDIVVHFDVDPSVDVENTYIAPFLFQPIIENIFKHAFNGKTKHPEIILAVQSQKQLTVYSISDNGIGLNGQTLNDVLSKSKSKGLKIMMSQLKKHYPSKFKLELSNKLPAGCTWQITLES